MSSSTDNGVWNKSLKMLKSMVSNEEKAPPKPLTRAQRRLAEKHAAKHRAPVEPMPIQISKATMAGSLFCLVLAIFFGIKTSIQAAESSKPFMEEFKEQKASWAGGDEGIYEPNPRDTTVEDSPNGDWLDDLALAKSMSIKRCDIERVSQQNMTTKRFAREFQGIRPVIIEGVMDDKWPAKTAGRWARSSLLSAFGDSPLHVSSGAGVVHSGGESLETMSLSEFLEGLRKERGPGASASAFTFDMEFVDTNKDLKGDFKIPTMFRSFNSHESMRRGGSWNIFSLGASGAGLPFHTHGETWLGVLYGAKRWALYPPEIARPYGAETLAGWHPLMGALEWFNDVEPLIKKTGEAPPLGCMQNPGDLIYVPANWRHMTLNIGECIGVGGQALYPAEARLRDGLKLIPTLPNDPEVLHSMGVGLAHKGIDALNREGPGMKSEAISESDFDMYVKLLKSGTPLSATQTLELSSISLRKALADRPGQPETHVILAETLARAGKVEEAQEVIESAWKNFSRDELPDGIPESTLVVVQLNLARFFLQIEDGEKAEVYLRGGPLAMKPDHGDAMADLAVALAMQGGEKINEAMEALQKAEALGAAGNGFARRREFVMMLIMQAANRSTSEMHVEGLAEEGVVEDAAAAAAAAEVQEEL